MGEVDAVSRIEQGFDEELKTLLDRREPDLRTPLSELSDEDAWELGIRAARHAVAPLVWRAVAGDTFDTTQVCQLLGVTRQAVGNRIRNRSLFGLPGRGITHFPDWQFDIEKAEVRSVVQAVLHAFADVLSDFDPLIVASWARTPQPQDLDGLTPEEWIRKGLEEGPLVESARVSAISIAG